MRRIIFAVVQPLWSQFRREEQEEFSGFGCGRRKKGISTFSPARAGGTGVLIRWPREKCTYPLFGDIDALRWLASHRKSDDLIDLVVNPKRPDRIEPRAVKRRGKSYPRMTKPRAKMRNDLEKRRKVA